MIKSLPKNISQLPAVGSDEVGVGDYLGPLVVAATYVDEAMLADLRYVGLEDSKKLSSRRIQNLAAELKELIPYKVITLENKHYNAMIDAKINANGIKAFLHNKALLALIPELPHYPNHIIIDQFAEERLYYKYLSRLPKRPFMVRQNVHFVQKAESIHLSVAAASILARDAFLTYVDELSREYRMNIKKGATPVADACAKEFLERHGKDKLKEIAKWHFANTKRVVPAPGQEFFW